MNAGQTARWTTRFIALAMVIVALLAFRIMESQLKRIGQAADRADARADGLAQRPQPAQLPRPATAELPRPTAPPVEELAPGEEADPARGAPHEDPARAAREESLPQPGVIPDGAVW